MSLTKLTADIVTAYVANNVTAIRVLGNLIHEVHSALKSVGQPASKEDSQETPITSVEASLRQDRIVCLKCGREQKTLKRHLRVSHSMTPGEYRAAFGLPDTYPMTAPHYSEQRRALAKAIGLGRKRTTQPAKVAEPMAQRRKLTIKS